MSASCRAPHHDTPPPLTPPYTTRRTISASHPLSPPYPPGQEAPSGSRLSKPYYHDPNGHPAWPDTWLSRPISCLVPRLNLSIVSALHFGFQTEAPEGSWLHDHDHFYPPLGLEERVDGVVVPVLEGLGERDGRGSVPDLVSITAGFWDT